MAGRVLEKLDPKVVWSIFEDITRVPHPSNKEEKIREWVRIWARDHSIAVKGDTVGNILLSK
jgi:dipeptidase D